MTNWTVEFSGHLDDTSRVVQRYAVPFFFGHFSTWLANGSIVLALGRILSLWRAMWIGNCHQSKERSFNARWTIPLIAREEEVTIASATNTVHFTSRLQQGWGLRWCCCEFWLRARRTPSPYRKQNKWTRSLDDLTEVSPDKHRCLD